MTANLSFISPALGTSTTVAEGPAAETQLQQDGRMEGQQEQLQAAPIAGDAPVNVNVRLSLRRAD